MDRYELAWAAGFFDGEGYVGATKHGHGTDLRCEARVNQAGDAGVPQALERFQRALGGLGTIGGPFKKTGRRDLYWWNVSSRKDVELLQHFLLPWLAEPKLLEFARTLERSAARSRAIESHSDEWRAWAAGLYDGEGSTYLLRHRTHDGYFIGEASITQADVGGVPEVLRRIVATIRVGQIYGPYAQPTATRDVYRWKVSTLPQMQQAIMTLWPWLGDVKRQQAAHVLDTLTGQATLPRGNPAWGNRKTHCVNGHEYAAARVRPFVARNGGTQRRDSSGCLACLREYARRKREEKRRSAADDDRRSLSEQEVVYDYLLK